MDIYATPNWTFFSSNNELIFSNGGSTQLAARHNACLLALLEAQGKTVDYDTLLLKVWGTQFRDTNTIASVISELRKHINCGDPDLRYILTVPKRGYRFAEFESVTTFTEQEYTEVTTKNDQLIPPIETDQTNHIVNKVKIQPKRVKQSMIAAALTVALGTLFSLFPNFSASFSKPSFMQKTLTFERGLEYNFSISPDKKTLVYINEQESEFSLISKNLDTEEKQSISLESAHSITSFAFSKDSNALAFVEVDGDRSCLYITRVSNGQLIMNEKRLISACETQRDIMSIEFSKAGDAIFYAQSRDVTEPFVIVKHDLTTGLERNLTSPPTTGRGDYGATVSPDGSKIAFIRDLFWEKSSIWVMDMHSGETRKLFAKPYIIDKLSWYSDDEIIFTNGEVLLNYSMEDDAIDTVYDLSTALYMPMAINGSIFLSTGDFFKAELAFLSLNDFSLTDREKSDYLEHTPTRPLKDGSFYFISNRSNETGIWKSQGYKNKMLSDSSMLKNIKTLTDAGSILLTTKPGKLIQIDKTTGEISTLKDNTPNIENYSYSATDNKVLYSKEVGESWYLESFNLETQQKELLGVSGYTGHFVGQNIYLTEFRQPGLWRYNAYTREKTLIIPDFESYFSDKWTVTNDYILMLNGKTLQIWENGGEYELIKLIHLNSTPRRIKCGSTQCSIDQYALGSTDIIELAPAI
ncbi:winged helix-turn-helix domain-containing protein [Pseudoalteromonas sp. MMG012]|uniref:winged helix-turn-helix domain-containing protein n=1 Tax=Pseudoalteromonas sp. MMG012 TaxID=2822686 RepID=UPI001B3A713E|nr:winged helix-turn-helix domain-containing protein [Pseudoalteromonas sp. MMG012]MBQ4850001.1 winged helix-turn-helix transcriptional regulator [Pseudoalteromonas sp. MMG012]